MKWSPCHALLLAGCASGGNAGIDDAPGNPVRDAARIDGHVEPAIDARPADARPADARPIDAAPPDACVPHVTDLLSNPAFDSTPQGVGWTQMPLSSSYPDITNLNGGLPPQSAPYFVWMGGYAGKDLGQNSVTDVVYQDVAVPPGTTQLVITGYYVVGTYEDPNNAIHDTANIDLLHTDNSPIEAVLASTNLTITGLTWTAFSHTFTSNVAGATVRLRLTTTNDYTNPTTFLFDTLTLQATHCP